MQKLFVTTDHAGFDVKTSLVDFFSNSYNVIDLGTHSSERTDYTKFAHHLAISVRDNPNSFGIAICGSGIGVSIVANRYKDIRAALIYNEKIAELSRQHNNANIACFGARFFSVNEIIQMTKIFLETEFMSGIHLERVSNIDSF
jgi:ribose 5-phosphate isomerase B